MDEDSVSDFLKQLTLQRENKERMLKDGSDLVESSVEKQAYVWGQQRLEDVTVGQAFQL